jgi:inositol oxygenase
MTDQPSPQPLQDLDEWEDFVLSRYPESTSARSGTQDPAAVGPKAERVKQSGAEFRDYRAEARPSVKEFYRINHAEQSLDFVRAKRDEFLRFDRKEMGIWEAMEFLNRLVDDSDPDTELSQLDHLVQTAEAIRRDGHPRWFVLTGLIHDLGKILCLFGEPQWAVVGDTFPVGCRFSDRIVFPEFFEANPDANHPVYSSRLGIYEEACGLDRVLLSWGHDEYLYQVTKDFLPDPALYMIRYHSFYPCHRERDYEYLMNAKDREMFEWVRAFNPYDLYSKDESPPDVAALRPYYEELIADYFPAKIRW